MLRNKKGKIKKKYHSVLQEITLPITDLVSSLLDKGLSPEEILGLICGQASICTSSEVIKRKHQESNVEKNKDHFVTT